MKLNEQFMDFEVTPNWWCNVIGKLPAGIKMPRECKTTKQKIDYALKVIPESIKDTFDVYTSDNPNVRPEMLAPLINPEWVTFGYNIKKYDSVILNGIANHLTPKQLKLLNDCMFDELQSNDAEIHAKVAELMAEYKEIGFEVNANELYAVMPMRKSRYRNFTYCDLIDDNSGSLKEKESLLGLDIMESPVDFNKVNLTAEDKQSIITYCKHDVWALMIYYFVSCTAFVNAKLDIAEAFGQDVKGAYIATNGTLVARALKAQKQRFADESRETIDIPKSLQTYISYNLPSNITDAVKNMLVRSKISNNPLMPIQRKSVITSKPQYFVRDKAITCEVELFGNHLVYANGGIHGTPMDNIYARACDEWTLIDFDGSSFYPFLMAYHNTLTRTIANPTDFRVNILEKRLALKAKVEAGEATEEENRMQKALKGVLVTLFGISGAKFNDCYDLYKCSQTCRAGQLIITALTNQIYESIGKQNIQIVQCNTDGVMCYIRRSSFAMLKEICDMFTEVTHMPIEFHEWQVIWQRDVNNYYCIDTKGVEKSKGSWLTTEIQTQTHKLRIDSGDNQVAKNAAKAYLRDGKDIVESIYGCNDIQQFVINANKGSGYKIVREFNDGREDEQLYKCNRVLASTDTNLGGMKILRRRLGEIKKYKSPSTPEHCYLVNEALHKYDMKYMRDNVIDYMWYITTAVNMINDNWNQMKYDKIIPCKIYNEE